MEEGISHKGGLPGPEHCRLYKTWGEGGWGVIITGKWYGTDLHALQQYLELLHRRPRRIYWPADLRQCPGRSETPGHAA